MSEKDGRRVSGILRAFGAIANTVARESGRLWVFSLALLIHNNLGSDWPAV
jgi:hypothetical protein